MPAISRRRFLAMAAAAVLFAGWASSPAEALRVGVNSAVNPAATGTPPGGTPQRLVLGQDVLFNERIATDAAGQTQILFVDASSLTVGPNSNMVIDQFVYDPNAGTGKLAASLTRGVFRFVGGALSKRDNAVTFRTPTATIGIRGGVMLIDVNPACTAGGASPETPGCNALQVVFAYGKGVTVTGLDGVSQTITRPGFQVTVSGSRTSAPAPAPSATLGNFLAQLDGRSGAHGGASAIPTAGTVEKGTAAVAATTASTAPATPSQSPSAADTLAQMQLNTQLALAGGALASATTPTGVAASPPPTPVQPINTPPPPPINIPNVLGGYTDTDGQGTTGGFAGPPSFASGSIINGVVGINGTFGQLRFPLVAGAGELSPAGAGTSSPLGPVTGTTYLSPDQKFFYADLTPVNDPTKREFVYGGVPVGVYPTASGTARILAFAVQRDAALQSGIPFIRQGTGGSLSPSGSSTPLFLAIPAGKPFLTGSGSTKALQASLAIDGTGEKQRSVIIVLVGNVVANQGRPSLTGVVHGSYLGSADGQPTRVDSFYATPTDKNGNSFYGGKGISGFVLAPQKGTPASETDTATQTTSASYQFTQPATTTTLPSAAKGNASTRTITGYFGGIMTREAIGGKGRPVSYVLAGKTTISTDAKDLKISATLAGGDPFSKDSGSGINTKNGMALELGSLQPGFTQARQAFINNDLFAALESPNKNSKVNGSPAPIPGDPSSPNLYLVTSTGLSNSLLKSLCACKYLEWGYWGGEIDSAPGGTPRVDVGHINTWVAGTVTPNIAALEAANATGRYSGNLLGTVYNDGAKYMATGGLAGFFSFGTRSGSFSVSHYDATGADISFTRTGSLGLQSANYSFGVKPPGYTGSVSGSFYGPGAVDTGGNFVFRSTSGHYFTSGIFGAHMGGH